MKDSLFFSSLLSKTARETPFLGERGGSIFLETERLDFFNFDNFILFSFKIWIERKICVHLFP